MWELGKFQNLSTIQAAEEHRHAYYLKKQIVKLGQEGFETYEDPYLIAPQESKYYLDLLDLHVCKYIKTQLWLSGYALKWAAYLFVTYAIEVRADELYPIYPQILQANQCMVQNQSSSKKRGIWKK